MALRDVDIAVIDRNCSIAMDSVVAGLNSDIAVINNDTGIGMDSIVTCVEIKSAVCDDDVFFGFEAFSGSASIVRLRTL